MNLIVRRAENASSPSLTVEWQPPGHPANVAQQCPLHYLISIQDADRGVFFQQIAHSLLTKFSNTLLHRHHICPDNEKPSKCTDC